MFIIGDDRIHMDDGVALEFVVKTVFDIIDRIVEYEEIAIRGYFRMEGDHDTRSEERRVGKEC